MRGGRANEISVFGDIGCDIADADLSDKRRRMQM
jgi:hypothetical protein